MSKNKQKTDVKSYHSLTEKQHRQIDDILTDAWNTIEGKVLTTRDKNSKGIVQPGILLGIESIFKGFANNFGLAALLPDDDED